MNQPDAVENAWRIHNALADWTGKVDAKASFALTIESATLAVVVGLSGSDHRFGNLKGTWTNSCFWLGVAVLAFAVITAVSVVSPRTRANQMKKEWKANYIYFGHLRHWNPDDLAKQLETSDPLPVLTRQLVVMAAIAWKKHLRVQQSLALAVAGTALIAVAGVFG